MKKRFLSIALAGALAATALVGCGKSDGGNKESKPSAGNDTKTEAKGSVYYLNFKPEQVLRQLSSHRRQLLLWLLVLLMPV